jgi:hypothetical protein
MENSKSVLKKTGIGFSWQEEAACHCQHIWHTGHENFNA